MSCLEEKAAYVQKLELTQLDTTVENKQVLFEMARQLFHTSLGLEKLRFDGHGTEKDDGTLLL